jgi:hypothetical protein
MRILFVIDKPHHALLLNCAVMGIPNMARTDLRWIFEQYDALDRRTRRLKGRLDPDAELVASILNYVL